MNKTTNRTRISEKGKQLLALLALVLVYVIAGLMTTGFGPSVNSNPSSINITSYTMAHDDANHISNER